MTRGLPALPRGLAGAGAGAGSWPLGTRTAFSPRQGRMGKGQVGRGLCGELGAHWVAAPHLPWTYLLSCWELAPMSLSLNPKSGCPQTHLLLRACVPERPPPQGAVLSQWEGTHFWGHTDRVQVPASPPTSPGTYPLSLSCLLQSQPVLPPPEVAVGVKCRGCPRHRGDGDAAWVVNALLANSGHDGNSQPLRRTARSPERVTQALGDRVAYQ